ncbi:MAG TPA: plastocyanin/azurin family copper-binding protein [Gaiellaceae bacterium]|jgi:Copper binding proteins, plastocyanin/azurin family
MRFVPLLVLCALSLGAAGAGARPTANPLLVATVGTNDGFNIGLADANGTKVSWIAPGTYDVLVRDQSRLHNFHLASNADPTVDFRTDLDFVGEKTFTVMFRDETRYAYACEPHWQTMNGEFYVSSRPPPPTPPPGRPPPPPILRAGVTPAGRPYVAKRSVVAGRYRLAVQDSSRRANFHLAGSGVNRRTGLGFTGRKTWTVQLVRGSYRFGSDPKPLRGTLRVR